MVLSTVSFRLSKLTEINWRIYLLLLHSTLTKTLTSLIFIQSITINFAFFALTRLYTEAKIVTHPWYFSKKKTHQTSYDTMWESALTPHKDLFLDIVVGIIQRHNSFVPTIKIMATPRPCPTSANFASTVPN